MIYGKIADVKTRKIYPGKITVKDGVITSIEPIAENDPQASACVNFILPGLVDSHIHIESTLMVPRNYARMAVANGVVAAVCDPHEIANVLGTSGMDFMIADGKNVRFNFSYAAPSCVPATPFETSGAILGPAEVEEMIRRDEVVALAEMMNVPGVIFGDEQVHAKLAAAKMASKPIDGHAPQVSGDALGKYIAAGITTDHECETVEEAREKLALGMKVIIREGSAACDFERLYPLIAEYPGQVMFCSDDMYPDDIDEIGYINGLIKRALAKGVPLWETLEAATATPVQHYGLKSGLLQAGDPADFIVVDNFEDFNVLSTYVHGEEVYNAETGINEPVFMVSAGTADQCPNVFNASEVTPAMMQVKREDAPMKVIIATEGSLVTGKELVRPSSDPYGNVITDVDAGISKIVAYSRYSPSQPQVAFIKGFGLRSGAIASTIAHDSHNIIAVGTNDEDIAAAINALVKATGGIAVCNGGETEILPLPVAGLMTLLPPDEVARKHRALRLMSYNMGCTIKAPFMTLAFMALPVIPELKLTDKGLFDGTAFSFTSLWE